MLAWLRQLAEARQGLRRLTGISEPDATAGGLDELTRALDALADAFLTLDEAWRFSYINAEAARILVPGGLLHAWTDVEEYFGVMTGTVAANTDLLPLPPPAERPAEHDLDYHTGFERKKRQAGFPIYRARWERK